MEHGTTGGADPAREGKEREASRRGAQAHESAHAQGTPNIVDTDTYRIAAAAGLNTLPDY